MGKLAVYKYTTMMFLIIQMVVTIFTLVGLWGGEVSPIGNTAKAMMVYALPILILANIILLIYWLIVRKWIWASIPFLTLIFCYNYIGTIYQFGSYPKDSEARSGIKIATYNVAAFGLETSGFKALDILSEMKKHNVDILCLQEYSDVSGDKKHSDSYKEHYPYMAIGKQDMIIYSRYPILSKKTIAFEETNNSAMYADISINGKTIRVFNVHLETTGFNRTLHKAAKIQAQGHKIEENQLISAIYDNYTLGMIIRSGQANIVANEQRMSEHPSIVCGDFNDVPYSYVYNTILGNMVDGFKECGSGWMYTYRGNKKVRIDYIFHDKSLKGICYYKQDISYSDHLPVFMKIEP